MSTPTARDMIPLPGLYTYKVITDPKLVSLEQLVDLTQLTLARTEPVTLAEKESKTGKYRSFTLTLHIRVYEEIEALYLAYQRQEGVTYVL